MQGGFVKFRKKQVRITLINSLIWGFAVALLASGTLLLISKLSNRPLQTLFYVLVSVLGGVAAACICYALSRPKDKKLAKRLDEEFALNERVQTMIEFQDAQAPMIRLQREDAQARLEKSSLSKLKWKGLWACLTAFVCAAAIFVTGLVLPKPKEIEDEGSYQPPEIVFEITDLQKTKLATLIKNVKDSNADDSVKTAIVAELEDLLATLDGIETATELYERVADVIVVIDEFVEEHNTYKQVYALIRSSEMIALQQFSFAIAFNDLPTRLDRIQLELQPKDEITFEEIDAPEQALQAIGEFADGLKESLTILEENETDGLLVALRSLIADTEAVAALNPTAYNTCEKVFVELINAFNGNVMAINAALTQQTDNRALTTGTITELIEIFNIPLDNIPFYGGMPLENLDGSGMEEDEEPVKPGEGIIIDGTQYPSNETIYDYYTKIICEYGKVFENEEHAHNYKKEMNDLISEGVANGTISPELEQMLRAYIDVLSGSKMTENV